MTRNIVLFMALLILFSSLTNEYLIEKTEGIESEEQKSNMTFSKQMLQLSAKPVYVQEKQPQSANSSNNTLGYPIFPKDLIDRSPIKGILNASVTIIEFSDFQCPYSANFYSKVLPQIEKDYINTKKLRLLYQHFPIVGLHNNSYLASNAAECAKEQNKFWEYHDMLWDTQKEWENKSTDNAEDTFANFASNLGLDSMNFDFCLYAKKYSDRIYDDYQQGLKYGVSGTPTFLITNNKEYDIIVGLQPYSVFKQIIDKQLGIH